MGELLATTDDHACTTEVKSEKSDKEDTILGLVTSLMLSRVLKKKKTKTKEKVNKKTTDDKRIDDNTDKTQFIHEVDS